MLYGFKADDARILKRVARREGLRGHTGTTVRYPQPLPDEVLLRLGKPDSPIASNATGTVSVWNARTNADTGENVSAKNLGSSSLAANKWCSLVLVNGIWIAGCVQA